MFKKSIHRLSVTALIVMLCAAASAIAISTEQPALVSSDRPVEHALPPQGMYKVDPTHSFAYFGARHHVVGLVRGRFDKVTGSITSSKNLAECAVDVTIDVSTISTQNAKRDEDLRSDVYFDANKFPTMSYQGRGIRRVSGDTWVMNGSLTLHGVKKAVPLTFNYNGRFADADPADPARMAFHGTAAVKRAEFGMGARDNLEELGTLKTPDVAIEIDVEADAAAKTQ